MTKSKSGPRSSLWYLLLIVLTVLYLLPFIGAVLMSLQTIAQAAVRPFSIPDPVSVEAFQIAWDNGLNMYYGNSLLVVSLALLGSVPIALLASYPLSRFRFPFKSQIVLFILLGMVVPTQVLLIPLFRLWVSFGLHNNLYGLALIYIGIGLPFEIFVLRSFMIKLPQEYFEAAVVDGASDFRVFSAIVVPLMFPAIITVLVIQFNFFWNEFLFGLVFITEGSLKTVPVGLANFKNIYFSFSNAISASVVLSALPTILIYTIASRYCTSGLTAGIKG